MKLIATCLFIWFYISTVFCRTDELNFRRISVNDGLSNNWARCIYHDNHGYIWVGTSDGLNQFDGYSFKIYRPGFKKQESIGDVNVNAISYKDEDELWICTDIGVYTFNYQSDSLIYIPFFDKLAVLCMLTDEDNNTWFGTSGGLFKLEPGIDKTIKRIHCGQDDLDWVNEYITVIFQDRTSRIWIGTRDGLFMLAEGSNTFKKIVKSDNSGLPGDYITSICGSQDDRIWLGTLHNGLVEILVDRSNKVTFSKILDGNILSLMVDYQGNLWVGKDADGGIDIITKSNLTGKVIVKHYQNDPSNIKSVSDNSICYIYEDKLKDIWIGTLSNGINYYSKREKKFKVIEKNNNIKNSIVNNRVNVIYEEENFLWIGTEGGLSRYNKKKGTYTHYKHYNNDPSSIGGDAIYSIYKDSKGNLWFGAWTGGLNRYNYETETFERYLSSGKPDGSLSNNNVFSICEDKRGNLWLGTLGGGLNRYNYQSKTFECYQHDKNNPGSISNNSVNHIYVTNDGRLFVSVYTTLEQFDYDKNNFKHFHYITDTSGSDIGKHIISIFEDSRNNIWLGTNTGLRLFNQKTGKFISCFNNHLPNKTIQGILEDSKGNLWISTIDGLSKIINGINYPDLPEIVSYTNTDGLSGNEFIKRAAYKSAEGVMYFGSSKGLTYFQPDSIKINENIPQVVFSGFMLLDFNDKGKIKYKSVFSNINAIDQVDLSYRNSNFVISFAALNYLHTEKNRYQYRLEGYDKEWIDAGNQRSVTYTNIQPGRYTFFVKGSNNDGMWNPVPRKILIIIHPPWWQTLVFRISLVLFVIIGFISFHYVRLSILKKQNAILELKVSERTNELSEINTILEERQEEIIIQNDELQRHRNHLEKLVDERTNELVSAKIKAEESDRLKSSFLANMSHEIRTPMNAIYGFSGLLSDHSLPKEDKERFVKIINENCESLLILIDDIIDISRIETDNLVFTNEHFDVDEVLTSIESFFRYNSKKDIEIKFVNKDKGTKLKIYNDKVRFRQIVNNLLNNAYKFTDKGSIKFGYERENIRFFIADTGIGINPSETNKIFSSFYKIENRTDRLYRGTGLGLAICKKLVEMMGGEICVESEQGKGSVFSFTLPDVSDPEKVHEQEKLLIEKRQNLKYLTILVAEDIPTNYELIRSMLKPFGANIIWAQNGKEAIEYVKRNLTAENLIVLMDIKMPLVDGYEATIQIKLMNSHIPVIAVTAYAQKGDKEKLLNSGFDNYLPKPVKLENLIEIVLSHTKRG